MLDPTASTNHHQHALRRTPPTYVTDAYDALARAQTQRDPVAIGEATRTFAERVLHAVGDDNTARAALREALCQRFLSQAQSSPRTDSAALVRTAVRHGVIPAHGTLTAHSTATALAWCAFRWEAAAARASLRNEHTSLEQVLVLLNPADRRALFAWVLSANCHALVGQLPSESLTVSAIARCASVRRDFVTLAQRVEPGYPTDEALPAMLALEGRALIAAREQTQDGLERAAFASAAQSAMERAHAMYSELHQQRPTRTFARYLLGAAQSSGP
ncbi:MAG: hypothetical protein Q8Q09_28265 [Deltaproteobacteria bacterium]|nr:hypothetical protein [Deltaproteobacteria bacterium]